MNANSNDIARTAFNNISIYTYINDWSGRDIANNKLWEPHILQFLKHNLTAESVFADVGSNYGWHSLFASKYCKQVLSFEPQQYLNEIQEKSIVYNTQPNTKFTII